MVCCVPVIMGSPPGGVRVRRGARPSAGGTARASRRPRRAARRAGRTSAACRPGRTATSPASRSTLRCLETPGWLRPTRSTSSFTRPLAARAGGRGSGGAKARRARRRRSSARHITRWQYERGGRVPRRPPPKEWAVPPPRPIAGQASAEYVALLAVVCAVVAGAAAVGSVPPLAAQVASAVRHGICLRRPAGSARAREARAAGLAPCLVHARTDRERLGGRLLVVKLGRGDALLVERRSDGSAAVSFADGGSAGAQRRRRAAARRAGAGSVRGGAGVQFTRRPDVGVPELRGGGALRAPLGPRGDARRRGARPAAAAAIMPPRARTTHLQGGRRVRRVRGRAARAPLGVGRRGARGGRRRARPPGRPRRARDVVRPLRRRDRRAPRARARRARGATTRARRRSRSRSSTVAPSSCACAPPRACTATSPWPGPRRSVARPRRAPARHQPGAGRRGRRLEAEVALDLTDPANRSARSSASSRCMRCARAPADWDDRVRALAAPPRRRRRGRRAAVPRRARRPRPRRRGRARTRRGRRLRPHPGGPRPHARVVAARGRRRCRNGRTAFRRNRRARRAYL